MYYFAGSPLLASLTAVAASAHGNGCRGDCGCDCGLGCNCDAKPSQILS